MLTIHCFSVADYAKKPLYRVTCGDLGIHPNEVEIRLKRVLNLGKIWNCGNTTEIKICCLNYTNSSQSFSWTKLKSSYRNVLCRTYSEMLWFLVSAAVWDFLP